MNTKLPMTYSVMPWWALIPVLVLCIPIVALLAPYMTNIFLIYFGFKFACHCLEASKQREGKKVDAEHVKDTIVDAAKNTFEDVKECGMHIVNAVKPYIPVIQEPVFNMESAMEVKELKDSFLIEIDVPGVQKEDVKIEREGNTISVCAIRKTVSVGEEGVQTKEYKHSFDLPETADMDSIMAKCDNGVLTITAQKKVQFKKERKNVVIE